MVLRRSSGIVPCTFRWLHRVRAGCANADRIKVRAQDRMGTAATTVSLTILPEGFARKKRVEIRPETLLYRVHPHLRMP